MNTARSVTATFNTTSSGATYYVSRNGNNADGRSWTTAWNEMNQINWSSVRPSDTIYLDGGTSGMTYNTRLVSGAGGTAQSPILFQRSEASGHSGRVSLAQGMQIRHPYITIDGRDKRYFEIPPSNGNGYIVHVPEGGDFFTLRNAYIYGNLNYTGGDLIFGRAGGGMTIQNVDFYGLNGGGEDHIKYDGQGTLLVEDSTFSGMKQYASGNPPHCGSAYRHCDVIQVNSGGVTSVRVRRSRFYDVMVGLMANTESPMGNLEFTYNIYSNVDQATNFTSARSVTMDNNVFDRSADLLSRQPTPPMIRNNIYTGLNEAWNRNHIGGLCNNCLFDIDTRNEDTSGTGNLRADPMFTNKANRDFSLRQGSPAINAGLNVGLSRDIAGNSIVGLPDIGAYEYMGGQPPTTYTLTVTKQGTGSGTVTGTGINCGSDCSESYNSGTSVTLNAIASSGSTFSSWSGACSGTATTCIVTMNAARSVTATFNATTVNQPPTVNSGADRTITLPTNSVSLAGTATDDGLPAGSTLTTTWSRVSGAGTVTFGNVNSLTTTAIFSSAGNYILRLTALDGVLTASDDVVVTVNSAQSSCSTSNASWQSRTLDSQTGVFRVEFDAQPLNNFIDGVTGLSQSAAGAYTDLAVIARFNVSGYIDAMNGTAYGAARTIPYSAGVNYHFRLEVDISRHIYSIYVTPQGGSELTLGTDYGFRSPQATVVSLSYWNMISSQGSHTICSFVINPVATNQPPTVSLTSPVSNSTFTSPATITLTASASDSDGTIQRVEFYNGTTLLNTDTTSPYSWTWTNVSA
ncbi:MAG: Ig-like domain-containing protein, partial [Patescibacteria group bacterium]